MRKKSIAQILKIASEISSHNEKTKFLRENSSKPLETILKYTFDDRIKFLLPEGEVPYKPSDLVDQENILYSEARTLYLFIEGGNPNLKQIRREVLFIELLEKLDKDDAILLAHMKDKKLPYKNITRRTVERAFPGLLDEQITK